MKRTLMLSLFAAGSLLLSPASAQEVSDLQPAAPQPPAGVAAQPRMYVPGQVIPQPPPSTGDDRINGSPGSPGAAPVGGVPDATAAPHGLILTDGLDDPNGPTEQERIEADNGTHTVVRGDTLWSIAATFLRSPWSWPKLWALNPAITNPHWIYPGDLIRLGITPGTPQRAANDPTAPRHLSGIPERRGIELRSLGFIDQDEMKYAGTVIGSKDEWKFLSALDYGYVQFDSKRPLVRGQRYTIYVPEQEIEHPVSHAKLGRMVRILGEGEVVDVTDAHIAKLYITGATDPIERGAKVGPLRRQYQVVEPRPMATKLEGFLVASLKSFELVAAEELVFVDLGKKDGVQIGDEMDIVRRGDNYQPEHLNKLPPDDKRFPREVIGNIVVLDTRDHISTGMLLKSSHESRVGDHVESHLQ